MGLSESERERYLRQLLVDGWGEETQSRIGKAVVGVAGAGGLGSPVATYLAAAGVGTLILCDDGDLEESNLNRQVMYSQEDIDRPKVEAAAEFLQSLNPHITVIPVKRRISEVSSREIYGESHLLVDCLDNWPTRFVLNRLSVESGVPFLHGGIREHWGQFGLLRPPETACLACFLNPPEDGEEEEGPIPVYGAIAGAVGSMMAAAALRCIGGLQPEGAGELHLLDGVSMTMENIKLDHRPDCRVCGEGISV